MVRALRHRNYRLFFGGQGISLIGTWMTRIATGWLIYRLTDSALLLGITSFASQLPTLLLGPFAGVWVDRWDRHRTLVITQVLSMIQSFWLAWLALRHTITVTDVIWLNLFQGTINAFDMPARQAFVIEMVEDREDVGNAIALNSSLFNGSRLIGPSIAGLIIAASNEGYCFLIDGISYIAVIVSLLMMRVTRRDLRRHTQSIWGEFYDGWQYAAGSPAIRSLLMLVSIVSLVAMPYSVLMPIFAGNILHGGPHTLGFLMAASGVGALLGALRLAARRTVVGLGRVIWWTAAMFGAGLIGFAASRWLWLSLVLLVVTGYGMMQSMAATNTILQTIVDDEKRGRVMSFYSMAVQGITPFGSLFAGIVAGRIGAPNALFIGGAVCLAAAGLFALYLPTIRAFIRPIYARLGIIPEVAAGLQTAAALTSPPED